MAVPEFAKQGSGTEMLCRYVRLCMGQRVGGQGCQWDSNSRSVWYRCVLSRVLFFQSRMRLIIVQGKTMFLPYFLIRLLQYKQIVLFTVDGTRLFLFHVGEVWTAIANPMLQLPLPRRPQKLSLKQFVWSLFDIKASTEPEEMLIRQHCFPIQTASPDVSRYRRWSRKRNATITGFPLWTRAELVQGYVSVWRPPVSSYICMCVVQVG